MNDGEDDGLLQLDGDKRATIARNFLGAQRAAAHLLGDHFLGNTSLEILLECFLAQSAGTNVIAADAVQKIGRSRQVTMRWISALQDAGLVQISKEGRSGLLYLTQKGYFHTCELLGSVEGFFCSNC